MSGREPRGTAASGGVMPTLTGFAKHESMSLREALTVITARLMAINFALAKRHPMPEISDGLPSRPRDTEGGEDGAGQAAADSAVDTVVQAKPQPGTLAAILETCREAAYSARASSYYAGILRSTDRAVWFRQNQWCVKCNLFHRSPCADAYMAFNVHKQRLDAASAGGPEAGGFLHEAEVQRLDDSLSKRMMGCFIENASLFNEEAFNRATRQAEEYVAKLKGDEPLVARTHNATVVEALPAREYSSTAAALEEVRDRLAVLEMVSSHVAGALGTVPMQARRSSTLPEQMTTHEALELVRKRLAVIAAVTNPLSDDTSNSSKDDNAAKEAAKADVELLNPRVAQPSADTPPSSD